MATFDLMFQELEMEASEKAQYLAVDWFDYICLPDGSDGWKLRVLEMNDYLMLDEYSHEPLRTPEEMYSYLCGWALGDCEYFLYDLTFVPEVV